MLELLVQLGVTDGENIITLFDRCRDNENVAVLKCEKSGVIFLSDSEAVKQDYYENKKLAKESRCMTVKEDLVYNKARFRMLSQMMANKSWLDIGAGTGGALDQFSQIAQKTVAVEPIKAARVELEKSGYVVYPSVYDVPDNNFEIATLFHVFEHMTNPIGTLKEIHSKLANNGRIIVEVPHANDLLISFFKDEEFYRHTFWSEHLILHTRNSLKLFLKEAGFTNVVIKGHQRYPLSNHLHWLNKGAPAGHIKWNMLNSDDLLESYANMLSSIDMNDSLIAFADRK